VEEQRVLIIIVTFNKKEYVANLLKSIREMNYNNYGVVVVDNASNDRTAEYIKETFPQVDVIANAVNTGGSGGFNTGLAYAFGQEGYQYYWLLDNDVVVSQDSLKTLVNVLESNKDCAVAGSQMCQLDNPGVTNEIGAFVDFHRGGLILNRHLTRRVNNKEGIFYVDYVAAASMLVRAEVAKRAGLWEDFFLHFDDVDWCLRIKKMGYKVVGVADSVIWHLSAAEKPITWQQYYDVRNMLYLLERHASKSLVARFGRRKCLQAIFTELRGMSPVAEIILDGIDDYVKGKKGGKEFNFPKSVDEGYLKKSHPQKDVFVCQNEWFDLKKFPFEKRYQESIKEIMIAFYLIDAHRYWTNLESPPLVKCNKLRRVLMIILSLIGYRKYSRAYVDIRTMPFLASMLSQELVVRINEMNWIIKRNRLSVWRSLSIIMARSLKCFMRISIRKSRSYAI
jgi:GT2 family glycosyltransferase